jgi:hypothetical protein
MTTEQQRYLNSVEEAAELARQMATIARRKADKATAEGGRYAESLEHGATVAEDRAAFGEQTVAMLRQSYGVAA